MTFSYSMVGAVVHLPRGAKNRVSNSSSFHSSRCTVHCTYLSRPGFWSREGTPLQTFFPLATTLLLSTRVSLVGRGGAFTKPLLFPRRAAGLRSGGGWKQTENAADDDGAQRKFWTTPTRLWRLRRRRRRRRRHGNRASGRESVRGYIRHSRDPKNECVVRTVVWAHARKEDLFSHLPFEIMQKRCGSF